MKKERLEDLGILYERLKDIRDNKIFEFANSKHDYEPWLAQFDKDEPCYDIHMAIRFVIDKLDECICIAGGNDE